MTLTLIYVVKITLLNDLWMVLAITRFLLTNHLRKNKLTPKKQFNSVYLIYSI